MERNSTNPVQGNEVPRQRSRNGADVDSARGGAVAEVCKAQVEEVDDEQQLGDPEVAAHPQVDEAEEEKVGCNVVGADVGSGNQICLVRGPERPCVD